MLTRFTHAVVKGDDLVDCQGPMIHVSVNRPDKKPGSQGNRANFRPSVSPDDYRTITTRSAKHFKYGFMMTYVRDSNYQMFVVVDLSRWWHMLQLAATDWPAHGGPGPDDTVAIVVSGTQGGSHEAKHPGGSSKAYIGNMIRLLARSLPFKIEVQPEDSALYFDNLWVPGIVAQNYLPCILRSVTPGVSEVSRVLAANSLAAFHASTVASARRVQLDGLRKTKIFIGRADVMTQHLDGTGRSLANEGELASALQGKGFSVVEAADFSEEEKAYIFELATTVVVPIGAGMVNLIFAARGAKVVFLCPPSLTSYQGQNMCDWPRDWFVKHFLGHMQMQSTVLRQARGRGPSNGFNGGWALTSVPNTVATIERCVNGRVQATDCS